MCALAVHAEVKSALDAGAAVVALESTIIAHGLPWPDNLAIARALEEEVRRAGAVPATIAVFDGALCIGCNADQIEQLAREPTRFKKAAASDLAALVASAGSGATTVSATALLAARAGISVFATGGIGGVHRGHDDDVSQDLTILSTQPVAVVSAGAKAILDLPRTLERLETLGVPVVGVGTDEWPAFYTASSGLRLGQRVDSAAAGARLARAHFDLGLGGILFANPIPDADALPAELVQSLVEEALARARADAVSGKALTPFLLAHLATLSDGKTLRANRALALNNARFAGALAVALAGLQ